MGYMAWFTLVAAACGGTKHPAEPVVTRPAAPTPTANDIMMKMSLAYRSATTYVDQGQVSTVFIRDGNERTVTKPFKTAFVRGGAFRFEYSDSHFPGSYHIIWSDGASVLTSWFAKPGIKTERTLSLAIAGATGVSSGSAHTAPNLLMPEAVGGFSLSQLETLTLLGSEPIAGHTSWKLQGTHPRGHEPVTLWIDRDTYLLRRVAEHTRFEANARRPEFTTDEVTTTNP